MWHRMTVLHIRLTGPVVLSIDRSHPGGDQCSICVVNWADSGNAKREHSTQESTEAAHYALVPTILFQAERYHPRNIVLHATINTLARDL